MHTAVQAGHFVRVMPRAGLMPLGALGVVGGRLVLPGGHMHRRQLMMRRGSFAAVRRLRVLFLDFLCLGICFVLPLTAQEELDLHPRLKSLSNLEPLSSGTCYGV